MLLAVLLLLQPASSNKPVILPVRIEYKGSSQPPGHPKLEHDREVPRERKV